MDSAGNVVGMVASTRRIHSPGSAKAKLAKQGGKPGEGAVKPANNRNFPMSNAHKLRVDRYDEVGKNLIGINDALHHPMDAMSEFEELVDAHYKPLYRFAYSLAKNPDGAADLVQQTFCIWAQKGHQLKDKSKAKTWLFTTLFREHLALSRRQKRYSDNDIDEIEYQLPAHEEDSGRRLDGKRALRLLGQLDENFRAPLTLFYIQQHSYKEIASILDVPMGTVMSRIARGKEQLRKKMLAEPSSAPRKVIQLNPETFQNHG